MSVAPRVGQPLDQQHPHAFGPAGPVRARGERPATAVGGQPPQPAELDEGARRGHHDHAADERHVALAGPQRPGAEMQSHQGRRTGGVDGDGRPLEPEGVRQAARHHAGRVARHEVAVEVLGAARQQVRVVLPAGTDEDAGAAAAQRRRVDAGVLDGLPGRFKQKPLLRIHRGGLPGGDVEEIRVEREHVREEAPSARVALARGGRVRVVQLVEIPVPVGGELAGRVGPGRDQTPQVVG